MSIGVPGSAPLPCSARSLTASKVTSRSAPSRTSVEVDLDLGADVAAARGPRAETEEPPNGTSAAEEALEDVLELPKPLASGVEAAGAQASWP